MQQPRYRLEFTRQPSILQSFLAMLVAVVGFAVAMTLGLVFFVIFLAVALVAAAIFGFRIWRIKRTLGKGAPVQGDRAGPESTGATIEGEYHVLDDVPAQDRRGMGKNDS